MPEFLTGNTYESIPTNGRPPFALRIYETISEHGCYRLPGRNTYPELSISYETSDSMGAFKDLGSTGNA